MSKRTDRIAAAKARTLPEREARRRAERAKPQRKGMLTLSKTIVGKPNSDGSQKIVHNAGDRIEVEL